jgi:hypothetical protein
MMSGPKIKPISPEERKLWKQHNIDTLREWRAIPFTKKIQMLEDMEEVARAFHGGKLPRSADEHEEPNGELR